MIKHFIAGSVISAIAVFGTIEITDQDTSNYGQHVRPIVLTENTADTPQDRAAFEDLREALLERGWKGVPGDGCECLYYDTDQDGQLSDLEMGS